MGNICLSDLVEVQVLDSVTGNEVMDSWDVDRDGIPGLSWELEDRERFFKVERLDVSLSLIRRKVLVTVHVYTKDTGGV